nr:hypothetical protein [Clostridia bacterium]
MMTALRIVLLILYLPIFLIIKILGIASEFLASIALYIAVIIGLIFVIGGVLFYISGIEDGKWTLIWIGCGAGVYTIGYLLLFSIGFLVGLNDTIFKMLTGAWEL